jgi:gliding motility-associated-like protein
VSNKAKSILLQMQIGKNDKLSEDALLSWSAYQKWYSGVDRYELYFMNDSLGTKELIATRKEGDTLWAKHAYVSLNQDQYCYEILAYKQDSNWVQSLSNRVCMETLPRLFAPNAFTCNNDNLNDGFLVQGIFVKQFELQIFNRWGVLVFESNDMYAPWDGKYNGVDAPSDVYVYIATGYGRNGKFKTIKGNVTLLR